MGNCRNGVGKLLVEASRWMIRNSAVTLHHELLSLMMTSSHFTGFVHQFRGCLVTRTRPLTPRSYAFPPLPIHKHLFPVPPPFQPLHTPPAIPPYTLNLRYPHHLYPAHRPPAANPRPMNPAPSSQCQYQHHQAQQLSAQSDN